VVAARKIDVDHVDDLHGLVDEGVIEAQEGRQPGLVVRPRTGEPTTPDLVGVAPTGDAETAERRVPERGVEVADEHRRAIHRIVQPGEAIELVAPVSEVLERIGRVDHVQLDTVSDIDQRGGGPVEGGTCLDLGELVAAPDRRPAGGRFRVLETERERARQRADVESTRVRGRVLGERQHIGIEGGDDSRQFGRAAVVVQQIAVEHP
jgi:hypothetical protein